jgi:two-component system phosphate regulon response regulator PhoB
MRKRERQMPSPKPWALVVGEDREAVPAKDVAEKDGLRASTDAPLLADPDSDLITLAASLDGSSVLAEYSRMLNARGVGHMPVVLLPQSEEGIDPGGINSDRATDGSTPAHSGDLLVSIMSLARSLPSSRLGNVLTYQDLLMDLRAQLVYRNGRRVALGPLEFRLLEHFLRHPRCVFSRKELLESVWGRNLHVVTRTVDVHIARLRKALNATDLPDYIRTVQARGYSLDLPD